MQVSEEMSMMHGIAKLGQSVTSPVLKNLMSESSFRCKDRAHTIYKTRLIFMDTQEIHA